MVRKREGRELLEPGGALPEEDAGDAILFPAVVAGRGAEMVVGNRFEQVFFIRQKDQMVDVFGLLRFGRGVWVV